MIALFIWALLCFAGFVAATWVYVVSQALVGRAFGIEVMRVAVGVDVFGWTICRWQGRHWEWLIGALPTGGYTKFRGIDDAPTN